MRIEFFATILSMFTTVAFCLIFFCKFSQMSDHQSNLTYTESQKRQLIIYLFPMLLNAIGNRLSFTDADHRFAFSRPACRSPMSTVGMPKKGASMIPLEELPIRSSKLARHDK